MLAISALLLLSVIVAIMQRQQLYDWYILRSYEPPSEIVELAEESGMSEYAKRIFFVNRPSIEDSETFNSYCRQNEYTIVLGCYIGGQSGIHIFEIKDQQLYGIKQVTAAHEMLHAGYDRLSSKERSWINELLLRFYDELNDERIRKNVETYRANNPDIVPNELHSILATEVRVLTPELEQYYSRYFTDRLRVVAHSERYEAVFEDLKQQIADYDAELSALRYRIDELESALKTEKEYLEGESNRLDQLAAVRDVAAFNAAVPSFNARLDSYNAEVVRYQQLISEYNATVEKRNEAAYERSSLANSINSKYEQL